MRIDVTGRKSWRLAYFVAVSSVSVIGLASSIFCSGAVGHGSSVGRRINDWYQAKTCRVLEAAPTSRSWTTPSNVEPGIRTAPPPYIRVGLLNTQAVQFSPSRTCIADGPTLTSSSLPRVSPGTIGVPLEIAIPSIVLPPKESRVGGAGVHGPAANADCAQMEVWMSDSMKTAQQTPATNDPNTSATLFIRPPLRKSGNDCAVWHFHYYKHTHSSNLHQRN
jgi:hypothetical protein